MQVSKQQSAESKRELWFDEFLNNIKVDKMMLDSGTADPEKQKFYGNLIEGKIEKVLLDMKEKSNEVFIKSLVAQYLHELKERKVSYQKIAFDLSNSSVLVWAQISDDDEKSEDDLIMAEATVNASFIEYGCHISTTIIEESDNLGVPPHYTSIS